MAITKIKANALPRWNNRGITHVDMRMVRPIDINKVIDEINTEFDAVDSKIDANKNYKSYVALVSQTGTNAPTIVELENTLGVTITPSRTQAGDYVLAASSNVFTTNKTTAVINAGNFSSAAVVKGMSTISNDDVNLYISTVDLDAANAGTDGILSGTYVEVRVYN